MAQRDVRTEAEDGTLRQGSSFEGHPQTQQLSNVGGKVSRIAPSAAWPRIDWRELWAYRGLFGFLVRRDVKARYSQTVLGGTWAVLQPLLSTALFSLVFGRFVGIPSDGVDYSIFALAGLVPWSYFATALSWSGNSLLTNTHLITKVYFPRLVIPFSAVLASLVDFAIAFAVLLLACLAYGTIPSASHVLVIVPLIAIMVLTAAGVGCFLAALNVQYRDVRQIIPFLVQVWMFASPIVYPLSVVPDNYRLLFALNPMTAVLSGFRAALLGTTAIPWTLTFTSLLASMVVFLLGVFYFRRMERIFSDVV